MYVVKIFDATAIHTIEAAWMSGNNRTVLVEHAPRKPYSFAPSTSSWETASTSCDSTENPIESIQPHGSHRVDSRVIWMSGNNRTIAFQ